jgi:hypothetical protein
LGTLSRGNGSALACAWHMHGTCMACAWHVHRCAWQCVACAWLGQGHVQMLLRNGTLMQIAYFGDGCIHFYLASPARTPTNLNLHFLSPAMQSVKSMLKGEDAAVLHTLAALGIPTKLVRVWQPFKEVGQQACIELHECCVGDINLCSPFSQHCGWHLHSDAGGLHF